MNTRQVKSLLLFLASFYAFLFLPLMPLLAQGMFGADIIAPTILHEPDTRPARSGDSLTIQASVSDNRGVEKVTLFYRKTGETNYSSIQMKSTGDTGYSATIPAKEVTGPKMEYYIQAFDQVRNLSVRGVKKFPLTLTVLAPLPPKKDLFSFRTGGDTDTSSPTVNPWYKKWWVWTIAAAVLGGVAAGGGGGGSGAGKDPITTGTATVSGPIP